IENMKQQLEASEQVAKTELQRLDEETEHLTAMQSDLARQKKKKEGELKNLKTQLESDRSSLASYREALKTEKRNLESAEDTLSSMRRRRDEAETMRNVGIGMMFIPFVGWIPMNEASNAVRTAKREVESCESQVKSYSNKVSKYESEISQAKRDIQEADNKIHETDAKLLDMSVQRRVVADVQHKMRRAVHQLGKLCGVGSVAELQTRHQILLAPVIKVMEEMTTAL
uniref:Myosin tail domain-containing protein n=1 Tax=Seriola dumerili TaxID=41447 RepID=A0A3B4T4Q1_SERDU